MKKRAFSGTYDLDTRILLPIYSLCLGFSRTLLSRPGLLAYS